MKYCTFTWPKRRTVIRLQPCLPVYYCFKCLSFRNCTRAILGFFYFLEFTCSLHSQACTSAVPCPECTLLLVCFPPSTAPACPMAPPSQLGYLCLKLQSKFVPRPCSPQTPQLSFAALGAELPLNYSTSGICSVSVLPKNMLTPQGQGLVFLSVHGILQSQHRIWHTVGSQYVWLRSIYCV